MSSLRDCVWHTDLWYSYTGIKAALLVIGSNGSSVSVSQNLGLKAGRLGNCLTYSGLQSDTGWACWQLGKRCSGILTQSRRRSKTPWITAVLRPHRNRGFLILSGLVAVNCTCSLRSYFSSVNLKLEVLFLWRVKIQVFAKPCSFLSFSLSL